MVDPDYKDALTKAIDIFQSALKGLHYNSNDRLNLAKALAKQQAEPIKAVAAHLNSSTVDSDTKNFLLVLTNAIWYYSNNHPDEAVVLYKRLVEDVLFQYYFPITNSTMKANLSSQWVDVTNNLSDWHLIVGSDKDLNSRKVICYLAASVQVSTGQSSENEANNKLWDDRLHSSTA